MKKIMVISDVHGSYTQLEKAVNIFHVQKYDRLIILGDLYYHGPRNPLPEGYNPKKCAELLNSIKNEILVVKGNCDAEVDEMISEFKFHEVIRLNFGNMVIICDHGHHYGMDKPIAGKYDLYLFGHYHIIYHKRYEDCLIMSPGSISLPKDDNYSYLSIDENGMAEFYDINNGELIFAIDILH